MNFNKENIKIISCSALLCIVAIVCFYRASFCQYSYFKQDTILGITAPSSAHLLGTDILGRDILARILYGGQISLSIGIAATATAIFIGTVYGTVSGFFGGTIDMIMMRIIDILYPMPLTIFVILFMAFFGNSLSILFISIGLIEWLTPARIIRSQVKELKTKEFILSSQILGQSTCKVIMKHVLPNLVDIIIVYATLTMPSMMLLESFLSFLGIGVRAPRSSWGVMLSDGVAIMSSYPWQLIFTSLFFSGTLLVLNILGNSLRNKLDPTKK